MPNIDVKASRAAPPPNGEGRPPDKPMSPLRFLIDIFAGKPSEGDYVEREAQVLAHRIDEVTSLVRGHTGKQDDHSRSD